MSNNSIADDPSQWTSKPRDNLPKPGDYAEGAAPQRMLVCEHSMEDYHYLRSMLWHIGQESTSPTVSRAIGAALRRTPKDGCAV